MESFVHLSVVLFRELFFSFLSFLQHNSTQTKPENQKEMKLILNSTV